MATLLVLSNTLSKMVLAVTLVGHESGAFLALSLIAPLLVGVVAAPATI
jgi:hypothetical protein